MNRINAWQAVVRQYGWKRCLYRLCHSAQRRAGILKLRMPAWSWDKRPLGSWLCKGVPSEPSSYRELRERQDRRFFFPLGDLPRLNRDWTRSPQQEAQDVLRGKFRYFSSRVGDLGFPEPNWLENPFTGQTKTNESHWCDQATFDPAEGDIKYFWEPSRFSWAYALVRAYAVHRDERYAEAFWQLVESWCRSNPPNRGPNWACGQEIAVRVLACTFALQAFWNSPASTPQRVASLVCLLAGSAERIAANIHSARAQMGNHATSEAAGLYTVGVLFPELSGADRWRRLARWVLEDEVRHFNWADGSYTQHSMNYHRVMLHAYAWCLRLGELNGEQFSDFLIERMRSSWQFLYQLQESTDGRTPNYGPNDGALILPLNDCDYLDYRPVIGLMRYVLDRKRTYESGPWDEDLVWLCGEAAADAPAKPPERRSLEFLVGGYFSLRNESSWGMVRCHTYRNRPNQADMLHMDLWYKGINVLRDSGTFSYYDPEEGWHTYFVSTFAHNTVVLGDVDQMVKGSRFRWYSLVRSRFIRHDKRCNVELWQGEHFGYRRLPSRCVHRRTICQIQDRYWLIVDDILGCGAEKARLYWHMADAPFTAEANRVCLQTPAGPVDLGVWTNGQNMELQVDRGVDGQERMGWQSLYYGLRTATPSMCASLRAELPLRFVSLVALGGKCHVEESDTLRAMAWTLEGETSPPVRVALNPPGKCGDEVIQSVQLGQESPLQFDRP